MGIGLLLEIIVLRAKLDAIDGQDFYFQKGLSNHTEHLNSLQIQYTQIIEKINVKSVDYFLDNIRVYEGKVQKLTSKGYLSTIDQIALGAVKCEISKYKNLLHIKGQFGELKTLDELMKKKKYFCKSIN